MRAHDRLDDLAVVRHLAQDARLLRLHAGALHGRQDLGLLPLGDAAEANGCKRRKEKR